MKISSECSGSSGVWYNPQPWWDIHVQMWIGLFSHPSLAHNGQCRKRYQYLLQKLPHSFASHWCFKADNIYQTKTTPICPWSKTLWCIYFPSVKVKAVSSACPPSIILSTRRDNFYLNPAGRNMPHWNINQTHTNGILRGTDNTQSYLTHYCNTEESIWLHQNCFQY